MKKYILLILLPFLLISIKSKSQATIGISPYSVVIGNDTLPGGASDSISFWVVNSGATTFNDNITLYTNVQDSTGLLYFEIDSTTFATTNIPPTDSARFTLYPTYTIAPTSFHYDINVIVIWPVALTANTGDSLVYNEFLTIPIGVDELDMNSLINAYPNPTTSNLILKNSGKIGIEGVRIYDTQGRLVESLNNPDFICTEKWSPGVYLINIQLENKKTHTVRVIKQ